MEKPPIELVVQALETFSRDHDPAEQQKASKWLEQLQRSVRETARGGQQLYCIAAVLINAHRLSTRCTRGRWLISCWL